MDAFGNAVQEFVRAYETDSTSALKVTRKSFQLNVLTLRTIVDDVGAVREFLASGTNQLHERMLCDQPPISGSSTKFLVSHRLGAPLTV